MIQGANRYLLLSTGLHLTVVILLTHSFLPPVGRRLMSAEPLSFEIIESTPLSSAVFAKKLEPTPSKKIRKIAETRKTRSNPQMSQSKTTNKMTTSQSLPGNQQFTNPQSSTTGTSPIVASYLDGLKNSIWRNKVYPKAAAKLKQQGKVVVNFRVHNDGRIDQVKIAEKCPFRRLNEAALQLVHQIGPFRAFPAEVQAASLNVSVPIHYILE